MTPIDVPAPSTSASQVWAWLTAVGATEVQPRWPELDGRHWTRVDELAAFWDEQGAGASSSALAGLLAAAGRSGADLILSIVRQQGRLHVLMGSRDNSDSDRDDEQARALREITRTQFPAARVAGADAHEARAHVESAWSLRGRACLYGVPRLVRYPPAVPILERLAGSGIDQWSLTLHAFPIDSRSMAHRYSAIGRLRQVFATELATSRRRNATETVQTVDPLVSELESLLGQEQKRAGASAVHGCMYAHVWISAPDQAAADALAAVAVSASAPSNLAPFPLRAARYSHRSDRDPGCPVTADELASIFTPPLHDVPGLHVKGWARFDANPEVVEMPAAPARPLLLGRTQAGVPAEYPRDLLARHACITGMTGSGKSAFTRALLAQLGDVPHLVIEPTKTEYADQMESVSGSVWRIGDPSTRFRLNPCEVPERVPLSLHIDLLLGLLRSTFGLMPPLPYLVEMGLRRAYQAAGWDPVTGENAYGDRGGEFVRYPTLSDVLGECLELVTELGYTGEVRNNVTGALRARLGSLTVGPKGLVFDTDEAFDEASLLSRSAVVNLDLVGNDEEKAFGVGLVLIRLLEARRGQRSRSLRHVTVVEEAHRIFRRTDRAVAEGEPANDFASETLSNLLSEVRSAGEGLIVVDQSPRRLADAALANTALKVAFRSTFGDDLDRLQSSMNLDQNQLQAIVGLPTFEAVAFWEGMDRPVRIEAEARHTETKSSPRRQGVGPAALSDSTIARLAQAWVAAEPAGRLLVERSLVAHVRRRLPADLPEDEARLVVKTALDTARRRAIQGVARTRALPRSRREQLGLADPGTVTASDLLDDGSRPFRGCEMVCPQGGCRAREVAAGAARTVRSRGAAERIQPGREAELCNVINAALVGEYGQDLGPALPAVTARCAVVQVLTGTSGEYMLGGILSTLGLGAPSREGGPHGDRT